MWDTVTPVPSEHIEPIYQWNGYDEGPSVHSILRYADLHGERLRGKYLAWVHDLGEYRIGGRRIIDHLSFGDDLSYWWLTPIVEQNPWKSPVIIDAIRLFALEEMLKQKNMGRLRLVSANQQLHYAVRDLCGSLNIGYEWQRVPSSHRLSLLQIFRAMPSWARGGVSLARHLKTRWPFKKAKKCEWFSGDKSIFICSYFFNIPADLAKKGQFYSRYWEDLPQMMHKLGLTSNWLQLYYPHEAVPNPEVALDWTERFNRACHDQGLHIFLDAYLSWDIVWGVLKRWVRLNLVNLRLKRIKYAFQPKGSSFSLWPLMQVEWHDSLCGHNAISNLLWIALFDKAIGQLPHQRMGLYLCENQAWERALIHAWRKYGHGQLIGVPHSTVRFWHLSYFHDSRTLNSMESCRLPRPDIMALNGMLSINAYARIDCPAPIVECEALRYGYLSDLKMGLPQKKGAQTQINVLVLGDYMAASTFEMLQLLEKTAPLVLNVTWTLKPHPLCPINPEDYPALNLTIITQPLKNILQNYDIACCSNLTSAAVDAYSAGLPVIVMLTQTDFNGSPLRGLSDIDFVSSPQELMMALHRPLKTGNNRRDFFFLDTTLPRWRQLLMSKLPQ